MIHLLYSIIPLSLRHYLQQYLRFCASEKIIPNRIKLKSILSFQLASMIWESLNRPPHNPYASNWLERLRKIRKIRQTILTSPEGQQSANTLDFTDMIETDKGEKARVGSSANWNPFLTQRKYCTIVNIFFWKCGSRYMPCRRDSNSNSIYLSTERIYGYILALFCFIIFFIIL